MLKELNKYENLGTPKFFHELLEQLSLSDRPWTEDNISQYFYNRIIDGKSVFDGCLPLATAIGAITIDASGAITANPNLKTTLINERYCANKLLEMIIVEAKKDEVFYEIFCSENISYDIIYRLIQIDIGSFGFRYTNFRQLLVSFGFLYPHPDKNIRKLIVNSRYKKFFDKEIMPEIGRRKIGIDELEKMLEQRQINGREAELFVVGYEKQRLLHHPHVDNIEMISDYDVAAGYDILSYEEVYSDSFDRFIEVKSFTGNPAFHWSRNEIDTARLKKNNYYIYLVDRDKMSLTGYIPTIIQNPHKKIIEDDSEWEKRPEGYYVTQSKNRDA